MSAVRPIELALSIAPALVLVVLALAYGAKFASEAQTLGCIDWSRFATATGWAAMLSMTNYLLRFARWRMFLARLGHRPAMKASLLCYFAGFALTVSPGKAGELVRIRYYERYGVAPSSVAAGFAAERLLDVAALLLLALFGVGAVAGGSAVAFLAVLMMAGLLAWLLFLRCPSLSVMPPPAVPHAGWLARVVALVLPALRDARRLLTPALAWRGLLLGISAWMAEGIGFWLLAGAAASTLPPVQACAVYAFSLLAGAVSIVPGGLGSTEAVLVLALHQQGLTLDLAVAASLACRLVTLWFAVVLGWLAIGCLVLQRRKAAGDS